jgi:release factor glutamine methyltransferase
MMSGADGAILAWPDGAEMPTIADMRRALTEKFRAAGIESPELDARILVGHALSLDHAALAAAGARLLEGAVQNTIAEFARRRLTREPVARIVGSKEFWSLKLAVNSSTLVPRPETETVVEAALAAIDADGPRTRTLRIADLGTGSGALLLALLAELPNAFGVGTDISFGTLLVAQDNARRLKFGRATFVACDLAAAFGGPFDLIVSNPPYVASCAIATLAPEVRDFDPLAALDGGPDGLDFYRLLAASAPAHLKAGGALVVEFGIGQAPAVAALLSGTQLLPSLLHYDLQGLPRAITAKKVA